MTDDLDLAQQRDAIARQQMLHATPLIEID
jgi:hypothetical protein